ncbi:MAG: excinuclease ABC subunit B [Chloroflexi bacterium]|jgi:excinuclease ABC subunit B|nr:MAG: excinuclease ABC subunit B [Chloroflexota bacterium]
MPDFRVAAEYQPTGDQPQAIEQLAEGLTRGLTHQTLLGVTGSGKTFTMAKVVEAVQKPTLVIAHNKTLAAQLATEFREFFPDNAVEYFVSYYDYYQPEAYVPRSDTYVEKESDVNDELDKLRHAATRSVLTRRDVLVVASVSCIYGLGSPDEYYSFVIELKKGQKASRDRTIRRLVDMQYERTNMDISRSHFRVRGDTLEILPSYEEIALRVEWFGENVERVMEIDPLTGEMLAERDSVEIYPARHFVTGEEKLALAMNDIKMELAERLDWLRDRGKLVEAQRLEQRTRYDLEMIRETGFCAGIENYSCHLAQRHSPQDGRLATSCGSTPWCLIDYFPSDFLLFIDESHMTVPQVRGMHLGDASRKETLVDFGFRLPSAIDNRPLNFDEFSQHINQVVYVSATPSPYELSQSQQVVQQVIRPTGLLDPTLEIKPTTGQIDDLLEQVNLRVKLGHRCLVTTLTKRMAEELADYLLEMGVRTHYLHSEVDTFERSEILRDLRLGVYDVVVGINLLREGLDLPEVSLVAILDADKEGYLRSISSLVQIIGRAARHVDGHVIMYADTITKSMRAAIDETDRRREIQKAYNDEHGITPQGIRKAIRDITERIRAVAEDKAPYSVNKELPRDELTRVVKDLEGQMRQAGKSLEFERAALIRDEIMELRKILALHSDPAKDAQLVRGKH